MTGPIPVEVAREQLRELISILGELRNAGPRDQRFKQWRQITVTLLQRIWPGDPTKADRFRRIPFSAPTAKMDRKATREHFERGCKEASLFLSGLAVELGCDIDPMADALSNYDDAMPTMGDDDVVDLPGVEDDDLSVEADDSGSEDDMREIDDVVPVREPSVHEAPTAHVMPAPHAAHVTDDAPAAKPASGDAKPNWSEVWKAANGPQPRLKDMLGFSDEAIADMAPAPSAAAPEPPPPVASSAPRAPRKPVSFVPLEPSPAMNVMPSAPVHEPVVPPRPLPSEVGQHEMSAPEPVSEQERHDLETRFVMESAVLQALAHSTPEPDELEEMLQMHTPTAAAQDVMSLAGQVEELGVPARERPIVRAALIDLARQMESPPVHWGALRETVAFAMDHPDLARRVLPLVLPYLDLAA